jgi:hypothetical protein
MMTSKLGDGRLRTEVKIPREHVGVGVPSALGDGLLLGSGVLPRLHHVGQLRGRAEDRTVRHWLETSGPTNKRKALGKSDLPRYR